LCLILRQNKPEFAAAAGIAGTIIILFSVVQNLGTVIGSITEIAGKTGIKTELLSAILKIVGIGYLCEFASSICKDAGANSICEAVTLGGKIIILVLAIPIIEALINVVTGIISLSWRGIV
jgi:stage III sporulation protein AD